MGELLGAIWAWLTRKEKASVAIEGFDLLTHSQREFNQQVIDQLHEQNKRLDECDDDREELRVEIGGLKIKVAECDEDRKDLRERIEMLESNGTH